MNKTKVKTAALAAGLPVRPMLAAAAVLLALCMIVVWWIFKTGYRLKN